MRLTVEIEASIQLVRQSDSQSSPVRGLEGCRCWMGEWWWVVVVVVMFRWLSHVCSLLSCCRSVVLSFCLFCLAVFLSVPFLRSVRPSGGEILGVERFWQDPGENKIEDRSDMGLVVRCNARECKEQCQVSVSSVRPCQCDIRIGLDG